jgi:hypothetical protein
LVRSDPWRSPTASSSFEPLTTLVGVIGVLVLAALAIAASRSSDPPPLQQNYPFVLGLEYGWCSLQFLEPVWHDRASDATAVCQCESRAQPTAVSDGTPYYGLFQIDPGAHGLEAEDLLDPVYNSWIAATLQSRDGWTPWPVCAESLLPASAT